MIGGWELIVILFVLVLLFGGKKLPEFARNLGRGIHEFKKATNGTVSETENTEIKVDATLVSPQKEEEDHHR